MGAVVACNVIGDRMSLSIVSTLGSQTCLRIIRIFADDPRKAWSVADLCDAVNVSTSVFHQHRDELVNWGFIEKISASDEDRRDQMYRLADADCAERYAGLTAALNACAKDVGVVEGEVQSFFG